MSAVCDEWSELRNAVRRGDYGAAEVLLGDKPELLEARNGIGETVLHYLAVEHCLPGIEWLHGRGASLDVYNKFGGPMLFEVVLLGYLEVFVWLLDRGVDVGMVNGEGQSLQEYLLCRRQVVMLAILRDHCPGVFPPLDPRESMDDLRNHRDHTIGMLELLASGEEQLAYEKNVPHVDITGELICLWFDDTYQGASDDRYRDFFTPAENEALVEFDQFYDERKEALPESRGTVRTWLADAAWREVMAKAGETLALLEREADMRNQRMAIVLGLELMIFRMQTYDAEAEDGAAAAGGGGGGGDPPLFEVGDIFSERYQPDDPRFPIWFTAEQLAAVAEFAEVLEKQIALIHERAVAADAPEGVPVFEELIAEAGRVAALLRGW